MRYAFFSGGRIDSAHDDDTIGELPAGAVALSDSQWENRFALRMQSGQLVACSPQDLLTLAEAKAQQIGVLAASYQSAILQPVTFTSQAGVAKSYQSDPQTVANLQAMIAAFTSAKATPTGFYWVAADNSQVPFSFADLLGLAAALGAQGWSAFQHLQTQKAAVLAASTVAAVLSVTW